MYEDSSCYDKVWGSESSVKMETSSVWGSEEDDRSGENVQSVQKEENMQSVDEEMAEKTKKTLAWWRHQTVKKKNMKKKVLSPKPSIPRW